MGAAADHVSRFLSSMDEAESRSVDRLVTQPSGLDLHGMHEALGDPRLAEPGRRVSTMQRQVLTAVRNKLDEAAKLNNGVVDARDLYTIRKEGVNEAIMQYLTWEVGLLKTMKSKTYVAFLVD